MIKKLKFGNGNYKSLMSYSQENTNRNTIDVATKTEQTGSLDKCSLNQSA